MHNAIRIRVDIQFVPVLPDIIQLHNIGVIKKLHDADLALQTKRNDFAASKECRVILGALTEIRQAHGSHLLCRALGYDFGGSILPSAAVPDDADTRAASLADGLA